MQYTYVGIDSHKDTHTAVFLDCFFERLGVVQFSNLPASFDSFLLQAQVYLMPGTSFMFGLEDCSSYGRGLMVWLKQSGYQVKHVNALLVAQERKNQSTVQKTDSIDAECAARVLLSRFGSLPDANEEDKYWVLRSLVARRSLLVRHRAATKHYLHSLLTQQYPNYRAFFEKIDCKTSLAFFERYPSPSTLQGVSAEELAAFLEIPSNRSVGMAKAQQILASLHHHTNAAVTNTTITSAAITTTTLITTPIPHQDVRDSVVRSAIRQIQFSIQEVDTLEVSIETFLKEFNCTLTSMVGIDTVTAAQLLSCIGDIKKFSSPAKLARYAGVAPVTYASGKKDLQYANQRGNRELNSLFFWLAVRLCSPTGPKHRINNSFFYDYYQRKMSEGKTKRQAIKCVERRLVNIIWTMLTNGEEYVNPPAYNLKDTLD